MAKRNPEIRQYKVYSLGGHDGVGHAWWALYKSILDDLDAEEDYLAELFYNDKQGNPRKVMLTKEQVKEIIKDIELDGNGRYHLKVAMLKKYLCAMFDD